MHHVKGDLEYLRSLLEEIQPTYQDAKVHSAKIDEFLDYRLEEIEKNLMKDQNSDQQFWIGLDIQIMQTPYSEILSMFHHLNLAKGQKVIDLGAAYGRMGIVMGACYPEVKFLGYEYVAKRVWAGNEVYSHWGFKNAHLVEADLGDPAFEIPDADLYFIYDFGSKKDVYLVLEKLRLKALKKPIQVIARGGGIRNWIMQDFPWLSQFKPFDRFDHWTLFRA